MKRRTQLRRRSDIRSRTSTANVTPRRRTRIKPKSERRIALEYGDYVRLRLARSRRCELVTPVCTKVATGLHHLRKRSAGGRIKSRLNTLRACDPCNQWVENFPTEAHRLGLVVRPGDPMWRWLGERLPSGARYST